MYLIDIVVYRPVAKQRPQNKQICGNYYWVTDLQTNMFPRQQLNYNDEEWCFLGCPCRGVISRTRIEFRQLETIRRVEFDVRWLPAWGLVVTWSPACKDMNTEVDGSTALEAVTRQRLVKTAEWEDLVRAVVWISDSAIVTCSYDS
jgi:hypothetical protein